MPVGGYPCFCTRDADEDRDEDRRDEDVRDRRRQALAKVLEEG